MSGSYEMSQCIAPLPPVERGKSMVLGGDPKGKNFLYCSGNSVVIRDIENPAIADIYTEHSTKVIITKYILTYKHFCTDYRCEICTKWLLYCFG